MLYKRLRTQLSARKARVEMIPLIDCMFLLLCFFIYVTMSMVVQRGIFVDLAKARTGERVEEQDRNSLYLSITREGVFYLDKIRVSEMVLKDRLRRFRNEKKEGTVLINADKEVTHERVMAALDLVRQSGIAQVVFTVEPKEGQAP